MGGNFYWSLGLSLIATAFGNSLQPIPVMSIVQPAAMLTAFQQMAGHRSIREKIFVAALLAVMHAILWTFAFGGLFKVEGWSTKGILIVFALGLLLWAVICGPVLLGFSSIAQHYPGPISSLFAFPCLWTAAYSVIGLTPLSTMANPAYALLDSRSLALAASMCGIHGLNFVLAHAGCIIHQRVSGKGLQQAKKTRGLTEISIGVLVALMVYGGAWGHVGTFYQRDIDQTAAKVDINVSCVLAPGKAMSPIPDSSEEWLFQQTAERVAAGDDIVLWSEAAVLVRDHNAAQGLLGRAAALQLSSNASSAPYLGITYWQDLGQKNMFVLLEPSGKVAWSYQKAHPVPFQMDGKPGQEDLPVYNSQRFGKLGGAICFDMDFPSFMRQAGRAEVDVLLQPSNTWGPVGEYHFRNNALRAVENGFTHVRCSAGGYSGVATPLYSFVHHVATLNQKTVLFTVPLRPRVRTFYVAAGYLFEVMNLAAAAALLVLAAIPRPTAARLLPWLAADTAPQHDSLPGSEPNILRDERVQLL